MDYHALMDEAVARYEAQVEEQSERAIEQAEWLAPYGLSSSRVEESVEVGTASVGAPPAWADADADEVDGIHPPLLIGGLQHGIIRKVGVDWLSVTLPSTEASILRQKMSPREIGKGSSGFRASEWLNCWSGKCLRKHDPYSGSKRWGLQYESWEFAGEVAGYGITEAAGIKGARPSRIDICWDYYVPGTLGPEDMREVIASYGVVGREAWSSREGQGGIFTEYVGERTSERHMRIYRKDRSPNSDCLRGEYVMRYELQLKGDRAVEWMRVYRENADKGKAYGLAAGHVHGMTGLVLGPGPVEHVPAISAEKRKAVQRLKYAIEHAGILIAADRAGVAVLDLLRLQADRGHRATQWRIGKDAEELSEIDVGLLVSELGFPELAPSKESAASRVSASDFYGSSGNRRAVS